MHFWLLTIWIDPEINLSDICLCYCITGEMMPTSGCGVTGERRHVKHPSAWRRLWWPLSSDSIPLLFLISWISLQALWGQKPCLIIMFYLSKVLQLLQGFFFFLAHIFYLLLIMILWGRQNRVLFLPLEGRADWGVCSVEPGTVQMLDVCWGNNEWDPHV